MPDKGVYFVDGVFNLVIGVYRLYSQLENQPVNLVYNECNLDTFLESVSDYLLRVHHGLEQT